uniref:Truncated thymidine kinase n=1 Tax=Human herpesvirus 1 TaxID=10298 RepID=Q9IZ02_HHV1|nr:truncated thymidine kinase [Human alphaherpesvirus 1]
MASYPCHQHASAFDQAARSRGHNNRRTALRPRRQQKATEVRLEQKMPTLLRVYIDGPHGMGKTTTTQLLVALGSRDDIVYVPEPMTYWRVLGLPRQSRTSTPHNTASTRVRYRPGTRRW